VAIPTGRARAHRTAVATPTPAPSADPDGGEGDIHELLTAAVAEAASLLKADGAMVYLLDEASRILRFAHDAGIESQRGRELIRAIRLPIGVGLFGRAVAERTVVVTGDYLADPAFEHAPAPDEVVREIGICSMVVAPLVAGGEVFGALGTFSGRAHAFDPAQIGLVRALADHAAAAMRNARLIEALDASRGELARRVQAEQALREIATRITVMRDSDAILQDVVEQAGRLVRADGVILDLVDPTTGNLHWALDNGLSAQFSAEERAKLWISVGVGATGIAVAEDRVIVADDDLALQFPPSPESTEFYERTGFHSMIAVPITGDAGPLGVLEVYAREPAAFDEDDAGLVGALAAQAAIAITNATLIAQLARSREALTRTADSERTLREIAARVSAILDPAEVLLRIVEEATRLLASDGARIDLYDPEIDALRWSYAAGDAMAMVPEWAQSGGLKPGQAVAGTAFAEQRPVRTDDYLEDGRFLRDDQTRAFIEASGIRSVVAVPLAGDAGPLGTLSVVSRRRAAYDDADTDVLTAMATQASIAIRNARLIEELARSRSAVARRAETERALREITARIAALRDTNVILDRVVEEAKRLLGTDGAHLTRMSDSGPFLVPVVVAGSDDVADDQAWLLTMEFPLGGGINGLAAEQGIPVWTSDYQADPRVPHEPDDDAVAERLNLCGMAAAPLRAPGGEVIGTLAVSTVRSRSFDAEELDLLQGLADQAAIAITNSSLLTRLTESEARYRYLVERAPDIVWSIGADARLTFLSDAVIRLTGHRPDEFVGKHFGALVHESSRDVAEFDWTTGMQSGSQEVRGRLNLAGADGEPVPAEFIATARLDESGHFLGANGSVRDMREQERLERELRASEARYRTLASSSPDLVFATDAEGRYTFLSDQAERMLGWDTRALVGRSFMDFVAPGWEAEAAASYQVLVDEPDRVHSSRIDVLDGRGEPVPLEINVVGSIEAGRLTAIHGVARDVSDRERLERELRASESRYRFLVENSPDIVFSTDAEGHFTFMSDTIERVAGWRPDQVLGHHFSMVVDVDSHQAATTTWLALASQPTVEQVAHINMISPDGRRIPVEVSSSGMVDSEGHFAGIHGSTRDISERAHLEQELRRQAGELAAGEERAHLARELHDSVTQALFSMTLV